MENDGHLQQTNKTKTGDGWFSSALGRIQHLLFLAYDISQTLTLSETKFIF